VIGALANHIEDAAYGTPHHGGNASDPSERGGHCRVILFRDLTNV